MDTERAEAVGSAGVDRIRGAAKDRLVSFLLVASGDPVADAAETRWLAAHAAERFDFHEIVVAASRPTAAWRAALQAEAAGQPRLRIIAIDIPMDYEERLLAALRFPIGDLVVCLWPGEVGPDGLDRLLAPALAGEADLVRGVSARSRLSHRAQRAAGFLRRACRMVTGRDAVEYPARAMVLTRTGLARLESLGSSLRFFRVLDLSEQVTELRLEIEGPPRRGLRYRPVERLRLAALLVSAAAPRLVLGLALVCLAFSLASAGYMVFALLAWAFLSEIAEGWTSTTMVFSLLFCVNFAVLGTLCLGLLELLRRNTRDPVLALATETGSGDRFAIGGRLNVEPTETKAGAR